MALYKFTSSGMVYDVDLDASGPMMRAIYAERLQRGEMVAVEQPKKPAAKKAAPADPGE